MPYTQQGPSKVIQKSISKRSTLKSLTSRHLDNFDETFPISLESLTSFHDPKSILEFKKLYNNDTKNFYESLKTDGVNGLNADLPDVQQRVGKFGTNKLPEKKPKSLLELAWEAMHDKVLILLSVAAIISLALGLYETFGQATEYDAEGKAMPKIEWVEGVAIIVAVVIVVVVGAANDFQKELQFAKLNNKKNDREIVVIRSGGEHVISIYDLLVGDIITLQTGDILPADAILVSGSCECDESALTGESLTIHKLPIDTALKVYSENFPNQDVDIGTVKGVPDSMLISGSRLLSGLGKAVVTAVGPNSIHGRTMESLKIATEPTPLTVRLNNLADGITKYGILAALILFIVIFCRYLSNLPEGKEYHELPASEKASKFLDLVITAITVIVVAVPEGLPLAVTLALAFATTRMAKDANLVRVLKACEIMGGATAVCSDKTGTLTENRMKVVNGNIATDEFDDNADAEIASSEDLDLSDKIKISILTNIALNSTAFENKENKKILSEDSSDGEAKNKLVKKHFWSRPKPVPIDPKLVEPFIGSKTETALLDLAQRSFGMKDLSSLRANPSYLGVLEISQIIPFESSRKWGGIVVKLTDNCYRFYVKGAAELVFGRCSHFLNRDNKAERLTQSTHDKSIERITEYAEMALRTISLAHKDYNVSSWPPKELVTENPDEADPELISGSFPIDLSPSSSSDALILDAIVGIKDPLRPGVQEAVAQCKRAGVTVRMVTGDNAITAKAISLNCGILTEEDKADERACMEGPVFRKLSKTERFEVVPHLKVLARSSPEDKRILVETLKKQGEVVAVTGDGTNDAPALKLADVGFSMGISGTEVAREASDIILMTDDFAAIVNAIKWGRCVASSIKKFVQFQLTVNITAVFLTFVSACASSEGESVLTAVQLLWVNLIMDTLAALALATDKPDNHVLDKKPDGRKSSLISVSMWKMILGQSTLQLIITFTLHFGGKKLFYNRDITDHEQAKLDAMTFNTFVWLQFFKLWVTRKLDEADGITNVKDRITALNLNFFQHLFRNWYFLGIAGFIGGCQVLIMFVGGSAFSIARQTPGMWATAIICGMMSLPWGALIRICPDEWALKIFPSRLYNGIQYVLSFKFLKKDNKKHHKRENQAESEKDEDKEREKSLLCQTFPAFQKTKEEIHLALDKNWDEKTIYNPFSIIHRWSSSRSRDSSAPHSDEESTIANPFESHTIATFTMVPSIVSAVAGFPNPHAHAQAHAHQTQ